MRKETASHHQEQWKAFVQRGQKAQAAVRTLICHYHCAHPDHCIQTKCQREVDPPDHP